VYICDTCNYLDHVPTWLVSQSVFEVKGKAERHAKMHVILSQYSSMTHPIERRGHATREAIQMRIALQPPQPLPQPSLPPPLPPQPQPLRPPFRFFLQERVEYRDAGSFWQVGTVVSEKPLLVQPDGLGWTAGYRWDEVRALCARGDPKPAPQPTVRPPSLPLAVIDVTGEEEEAAICGRPGCIFA
jgi:hypothetical protein